MAKSSDIQAVNVRLADESLFSDGERLPLSVKDMGACGKVYFTVALLRNVILFVNMSIYFIYPLFLEVFPQAISHHPNGRLIAVCGDGEYVVYTAQVNFAKAPFCFLFSRLSNILLRSCCFEVVHRLLHIFWFSLWYIMPRPLFCAEPCYR